MSNTYKIYMGILLKIQMELVNESSNTWNTSILHEKKSKLHVNLYLY